MWEWLRRLLFQIKCGYCHKPLSEDEEMRLGRMSLCPDCFRFITARKTANNTVNKHADKSAIKKANKTAHNRETNIRHATSNKTAHKKALKVLTFGDLARLLKGD